jgi:hypothetical protein
MESICAICEHPIKVPICFECRINEILSWFSGNRINGAGSFMALLKKRLNRYSLFSERCVLCNSENTNICSACFFTTVKSLFEEKDKLLATRFSCDFDFLND